MGDNGIGIGDELDTSDRPLISVVVPVRNGMPWLEHQLLALSTQEVAADWEVVVADNGSEDGTRPLVERWSNRTLACVWWMPRGVEGLGQLVTSASDRPVAGYRVL